MGSFLSYPLTTEPDYYELPAYKESENEGEDDLSSELYEVNLRFCKGIVDQGVRSRYEEDKFDGYRHNWSEVVAELKEKYPQWTPKDFLNLRQQFKAFDSNGLYLLDYDDFIKALDFNQENSSHEQRSAMLDSEDTHHYNSINFEEYLQLMNNFNIGTPVPRAPKTENIEDPVSLDIISDVKNADTFIDMCYRLF